MNPDQIEADLRAAIDERLTVLRQAARRRAAEQRRVREEKTARRNAGLKARHHRKLNRDH